MKKALIIFIVLLLVSTGLTIYFGLTSKDAYNRGYNEGTGDITAYEQMIEEYKNDILKMSSELENAKTELTETITKLNNALEQNSQDKQKITELTTQIEDLTNQISTLQNEIEELELKLEAYAKYEGVAVSANFYVDGKPYSVDIINIETDVVEFPTNFTVEGARFAGWSLDGQTVIQNTENYTITEDTDFYAVLMCDINFYINGTNTTKSVIKGTILNTILPDTPEYDNYIFEGFYQDENKVEEEIVITQHMSLIAKFREFVDLKLTAEQASGSINGDSINVIFDYADTGFVSDFFGFLLFDLTINEELVEDYDSNEYTFNVNGKEVYIMSVVSASSRTIFSIYSRNYEALTENDIEDTINIIFNQNDISIRIYNGVLTEVINEK